MKIILRILYYILIVPSFIIWIIGCIFVGIIYGPLMWILVGKPTWKSFCLNDYINNCENLHSNIMYYLKGKKYK
jgi:hypothetical protein